MLLDQRAYSSAVEPPAHNRVVPGSIPGGPTTLARKKSVFYWGALEKWLNSPAFHAGIQGFESPTGHKGD